jgi:NAD(P)-dependent dehydrogenase (short-subunit alcohol dehydrogenase family)
MRCAGKAGVVTGTSRGLGRETLLALAAEGANVVGVARDEEAGGRVADEASSNGGRALFQRGDVRREEDIVAAVERCRAEFGALDFMVNNAGILGEGRLHETSNEQWDDLVATHLTATFWGCKHAIDAMRESGRGGSIGIRCNCVCPGDMETPMIEQYFEGTADPVAARAEMEGAYPGKRIAHPREVAAAVVFLVSDESSFVSGAPILVDGGLTAKTY